MSIPARVFAIGGLFRGLALALVLALLPYAARTAEAVPAAASAPSAPAAATVPGPMLALGVGDSVSVQVYGRPELTITTYVADDGSIPVPLAGRVHVAGLAPADAAEHIAAAYRDAKFLVDPQVTVLLLQ